MSQVGTRFFKTLIVSTKDSFRGSKGKLLNALSFLIAILCILKLHNCYLASLVPLLAVLGFIFDFVFQRSKLGPQQALCCQTAEKFQIVHLCHNVTTACLGLGGVISSPVLIIFVCCLIFIFFNSNEPRCNIGSKSSK